MRNIPMVLLLELATMMLKSSDRLDLAQFGALIYRNGETSTKRRKKSKSLDGELVVNVNSKYLWALIKVLDTFTGKVLGVIAAL